MPRNLPKSPTKPSLAEREASKLKRENKQRGKKIDKDRQRKSSRNGGALKPSKQVLLTGTDRYWIQNAIEKIKPTARTQHEKILLRKIR
jgi:hypothetical protein